MSLCIFYGVYMGDTKINKMPPTQKEATIFVLFIVTMSHR